MEGDSKEAILKELEDVQQELKHLAQASTPPSPTPSQIRKPQRKHSQPNVYTPSLLLSVLFLSIFFITIPQATTIYQCTGLLALVGASITGLGYVASNMQKQKQSFSTLSINVVLIATLAIAYYLMWPFVANYFIVWMIFFGVLLCLATIFFLLHAYLVYLHRMTYQNMMIAGLILGIAWTLFFLALLSVHSILFLLLLIMLLLLGYLGIDFSKQWRKKSN